MIDLIIATKACLGLVLLTGLVTGFLYTLLSARETYLPKVKALQNEIAEKRTQIKALEEETASAQARMEEEHRERETIEKDIEEARHAIDSLKEQIAALKARNAKSEESYGSVHAMLQTQQEREAMLRKEIGEDTAESLLAGEATRKEEIASLRGQLSESKHRLNETIDRHKRLEAQKEEFRQKRDRLSENAQALEQELEEKRTLASGLEQRIQEKIAALETEANRWKERIAHYRNELLRRREERT